MTALRAGVLGLGMMGRHHVRVLSTLPGVELVGVADRDGDPHGAAGAAGVEVHACLDDLLKVGLDLCVVAVPTQDHANAALRLAASGVAALVEKPLAATTEEALAVVAAFESAGVVGSVGHIERFNPALQAMRQKLSEGLLGRVFQVATRRQGPFPARIQDVGVVKDLGTHDLDLTAWVVGAPFASVSAQVAHQAGRAYEDLVSVTGRLESGVVTSHLVNWLSPVKERKVVVTGEGGWLEADTLSADLTFAANGSVRTTWDSVSAFRGVSEGDTIRYAIPKPEPLRAELEAFRDAVLGDPSRTVALRDGLAALRVAEAVLESARDASVVTL